MPIKTLTVQASMPPVIGVLRKGDEAKDATTSGGKAYKTYGADLDHFRFTAKNEKDTELEAVFASVYGDTPQEIEAYLPSDDLDETCMAFREEYNAGGLVTVNGVPHRCDGEVLWQRNRYTGKFEPTDTACPYAKLEDGDKGKKCKQVGRLHLLLPQLLLAGHYGVVTVLTHSLNDISRIYAALSDFKGRFGRLTGGAFYVYRYEESISTPNGSGGKTRRDKWLVGIKPATEYVQNRLDALRQNALPAPQPQLASGGITKEQWETLAAMAKSLYRDTWSTGLSDAIEAVTNGRTRKPKDLTDLEAIQVYDHLEAIELKMKANSAIYDDVDDLIDAVETVAVA